MTQYETNPIQTVPSHGACIADVTMTESDDEQTNDVISRPTSSSAVAKVREVAGWIQAKVDVIKSLDIRMFPSVSIVFFN